MTDQEPPVDDIQKSGMYYPDSDSWDFKNRAQGPEISVEQEGEEKKKKRLASAQQGREIATNAHKEAMKDPVYAKNVELQKLSNQNVNEVGTDLEKKALTESRERAADASAIEENNKDFEEHLKKVKDASAQDARERMIASGEIESPQEGAYKPLGGDISDDDKKKFEDRQKEPGPTQEKGTEKKESVIEDKTGTSPDMKDPDLMYRHMEKVGAAIAQAAAEMGGQMVSRGWDLAGDIVRMTFTQPHAMSSTSRMIGTAMGSLEMAGDFADRAAQKYGINLQQDPGLMKDTIKYKLYKREAQQANGVVGNTFRAIAGSLDKMGVQDISQMTPDQLSQHVADMRQEAARLSNIIAQDKANTQLGRRQNRLSSQDRALVYAQAKHLQSYMDQLSKQGATMAADQRAMARQQRQASRQQRLQAQSTLANGQANPYQQILQWADPNANWEIDGTTGMPTKAGTYNTMLRTLRDKRAQEIRANGKLTPERQKWYDDMDSKLMEHKNLVDNEARRAPLRPYGNVFVGISDYAPGIRSHLPRILKHGDWSSLQFTRNIRGYLAGIVGRGGSSPEYRHARALLLSLDLSTKTRALRTSIGTIDPRAMERARLFHDKEGDPYRGHPFDAVEAEYDEAELGKAYEKFNSRIPKDVNDAQRFDPEDPAFRQALNEYQAKMREYKDKWFPLRDRSKDDDPVDNEDISPDTDGANPGAGGSPKRVRTGGKRRSSKTVKKVVPAGAPSTSQTKATVNTDLRRIFSTKEFTDKSGTVYQPMSKDERLKQIGSMIGEDLLKGVNEYGRFTDVDEYNAASAAMKAYIQKTYPDVKINKYVMDDFANALRPNAKKDDADEAAAMNDALMKRVFDRLGMRLDENGKLSPEDYEKMKFHIETRYPTKNQKAIEAILKSFKPVPTTPAKDETDKKTDGANPAEVSKTETEVPQILVVEEGTGKPEDEKAQYIKDHLDEGISTVRMAPEDMKETIEGFKDPETAKGYERELEDIADEFGMESITPETIGDAWSSNSLYGWDKEGKNLFRAMEILMSKAYAEGGEAAYQEVLNRMGASIAGARFDEDRIRSGWAGLDDGEIKSRRDAKVSEIYNNRNKRMLLRAWERGDRAAILNNPSVLERYGLEIQGDQLVPKATQPAPPTAETETPKGPEEVIDEATPGAEEAPEKKPKELEPAEKEKVDSIREHMGFKENEDGFRKYIDDTIKKVNSSFKSESAVKNNVLTIYGDGSKEFWKRFMKQVEADKKELPADLVTADLLKKALVPYIQMEAKQGRLENVSENKTKEERIQKIGERKQRVADDTEGLHAVSDQIRSTRDEREQHTQAFEGKEKENPLPELFNKKGKRVDYSRGGLWDGIIEFTKGMSGMSPEERAASIGDVKAYNEELQKRFDEAAERLRDPDYVNKLAQGEYERRTKRLRAEAESQIKTAMAEAQKRAQKKIMEFEAKMEEDPTYRGKGHITKVKNALKRELRDIAKKGQADFKLKMNTLEKDMVQLKHDLQVGVNNEISALERAGGKWSEYTKDLVDQPAGLRTQLQRVKVDELEKETPETVENKEYKTLDPQEYVEQFRASPDNTSYESIVNNIKAAVKERYPDAESDVLDNKVRGYTKQVDALRPNTWESGSLNSEDAGHAVSSFNPESPDYKAQQKAKAEARSTLDELIGILNGDEDMGDPREVVAKARKVAQGYFTGENDTKQIDDALAAYYTKFPQYKPKLGNEELFKQYQDQISAAQSISPVMEGNITHDVRLSQEQRTQLEELIKERKGKSTPKRPTPPVEEAAPNGVNPFGDYEDMEGFYEGLEEDIRLAGKIDKIDKQRFETALNSLSDPAEKKKWRNKFAILTSDIDTAQRQQSEKDKDDERLKGFDNIESYVKDFEDGNREATVITKEELAHIRNAINTDPDLNQEGKEAYLRRIQAVEDHVNRTKRLMDMIPLASYNTIYEMVDAIENKDWYALMDLMDPRDFDEVDDPSERITLFEDFLDDTGVSDSDKMNAIAILRPALKGRCPEDPRPKSFRDIMRERNPDWE